MVCLALIGVGCFCTQQVPVIAGGGGTETVVGKLVTRTGIAAPGAVIKLLPADYDPFASDEALTGHRVDTTDAQGAYSFYNITPGVYTLQAKNPVDGSRSLNAGISLTRDSALVLVDTLRIPGTLKVVLPATADTVQGYVYIPGTEIGRRLRAGDTLTIDSVPAGLIPAVIYAELSTTAQEEILSDVTVPEGDTVVVRKPGWRFSRKLYFNTTAAGADVSGDVHDFPVLVRLTKNNFGFDQAAVSGTDLYFTKSDSTPLPFEIQRWDAAAGLAEVWVCVDTIFGNDSTHYITMSWGNPEFVGQTSSAAVFDTTNDFVGVWHMDTPPLDSKGDSVGAIRDVSANMLHGTTHGAMGVADLVAGQIGKAIDFDGVNDYIDLGNAAPFNLNREVTLEAWINPAMYPDSVLHRSPVDTAMMMVSDDAMIIAKYDAYTLEFQRDGNLEGVETYKPITSHVLNTQSLKLNLNTWYHVAVTYDGNFQSIYLDGTMVARQLAADTLNVNTFHTLIGYIEFYPGIDRFFPGKIDEVRISKTARSADWLKLDAVNQRENDILVRFK
jgi:hypothetical protein